MIIRFSRLLLALVLLSPWLTATQIRDTLAYADGKPAVADITISWSTYQDADGNTVPAGSMDVKLRNGVLSVTLRPYNGYRADWKVGPQHLRFVEYWNVSDSSSPLKLSDIRTSVFPDPSLIEVLGEALPGGAPHSSSHKHGGADEVATATPGVNAIPKAGSDGKLASGWIPDLSLQYWPVSTDIVAQSELDAEAATRASADSTLTTAVAGKAPATHATQHKNGGTDEVATGTPAANAIPKADSGGKLASGWLPDLSLVYWPISTDLATQSELDTGLAGKAGSTHASQHKNGGSDEVATATSAPNAIPKAGSDGKLHADWIPEGAGTGPHAANHRDGGSDEVATSTPAVGAIPKADGSGKLGSGWIPDLNSTYATDSELSTGLAGKADTTHATAHKHGGSDEVAVATPAANAIPKAGAGGSLASGWIPDLSATYWPQSTDLATQVEFLQGLNNTPGVCTRHGSFQANTSAGVQIISGLGCTPKAVIAWSHAANVDGMITGYRHSFGMATASSQIAIGAQKGNSSNATGVRQSNAHIALEIDNTGAIIEGVAFAGMTEDGFSVNVTEPDGPGLGMTIHFMVIGGGEAQQATLLPFTSATVTGSQNVTGLTYTPDSAIFLTAGLTGTIPGTGTALYQSLGFVNSSLTQAAWGARLISGITGGKNAHANNFAIYAPDTAAMRWEGAVTAFIDGGATVNWTAVQGTGAKMWGLFFKGVSIDVGTITMPTTATTQPITLNHISKGMLIGGSCRVNGAGTQPQAWMAVGGVDTNLNQSAIWAGVANSANDANAYSSSTSVVECYTQGTTPTLRARAVATGLDQRTLTLNWTNVDTFQYEHFYWSFGEPLPEPKAHGVKHQHGGSDEVATATPGANAIPKADSGGKLASGWIPDLSGTYWVTSVDVEEETHASEHKHGGNDEVATATPGANEIPKADGTGKLATGWIPSTTHASQHKNGGADEVSVETPAAYAIPKAGADGKLAAGWIPEGSGEVGPHASTHKNGGGDEVATDTPANNAIPKADGTGKLANGWIPDLSATYWPQSTDLATQAELDSGLAGKASTSHNASHQNGGSDEVATATAAANAIPKAGSDGKLATGWIPDLDSLYATDSQLSTGLAGKSDTSHGHTIPWQSGVGIEATPSTGYLDVPVGPPACTGTINAVTALVSFRTRGSGAFTFNIAKCTNGTSESCVNMLASNGSFSNTGNIVQTFSFDQNNTSIPTTSYFRIEVVGVNAQSQGRIVVQGTCGI